MDEKIQIICIAIVLVHSYWSVQAALYKTYLKSVEDCQYAEPPLEKNSPIKSNIIPYNKSGSFYFKGNISIEANMRGYFWNIKSGFEKSGVVRYTNNFKKLTCKSFLPKLMLIAANVRYNEKTCEIYKGNYTFQKMDFSGLDYSARYFPIKEPGESVVYLGIYRNKVTVYCTISHYVLLN